MEKQDQAQAYALRVWEGQSPDLSHTVRVERVKRALDGQGLSMAGVVLPQGRSDDAEPVEPRPFVPSSEPVGGDLQALLREELANLGPIPWAYWRRMRLLAAAAAVRLLCALDPVKYKDLSSPCEGVRDYDTAGMRAKAEAMELMALDHGLEKATAAQWWAWCNEHFPCAAHPRFASELVQDADGTQAERGRNAEVGAINPIDPIASKPCSDSPSIKRQDPMRALIVRVMEECERPGDANLVWARLMDLAIEAQKGGGLRFPLTGEIKGNSQIGWVSNRGGKTKWLDLQAFKERHRKLQPKNQDKAR